MLTLEHVFEAHFKISKHVKNICFECKLFLVLGAYNKFIDFKT